MSRLSLWVCVLWCATALPVRSRAQDAAPELPSSALRSTLWLSAGATLLCASLGGYYALKVQATYDRAHAVPDVSPERTALRRTAERAEYTADGFFIATGLLAATSIALLIASLNEDAPPHARSARAQFIPTTDGRSAGLVYRGSWQ